MSNKLTKVGLSRVIIITLESESFKVGTINLKTIRPKPKRIKGVFSVQMGKQRGNHTHALVSLVLELK